MASPIVYESNESDTDESIPEIDLTFKLTVQPYQHEPVRRQDTAKQSRNDESDSGQSEISQGSVHSDEEISEHLPSDMHWCSCKNCITMPTARECKCCHFYAAIEPRLEETGVTCITEHEGFAANCLNRWVLETSFYEYLQENGPLEENELVHNVYRHLAYRRFVLWILQRLGKRNRKILPSCVVTKIRTAFPSQQYCGFKYSTGKS